DGVDPLRLPESTAAPPRVLRAGSTPPDERLHEAAEPARARIGSEAHALPRAGLGPAVDAAGARARHYERADHGRARARHLRAASIAPRAFFDRGAWIVGRARAARAAGVVVWLAREDEALAWTAPALERALAAAGVPVLMLTARRWQADDDTPVRIAEFVRRCSSATA